MKKIFLGLIALTFLAVATQAQVTFAPRVGFNMANIGGDNADDFKMKSGMQIGAVANIGFSDALSLQPALLFSQKGTKEDWDDATIKMSLNYLELPINVVYGLNLGGNQLQFFAGPYLGYGISGKISSDVEGFEDIDVQFISDAIDADEDKAAVAPLDLGFNIGAGYKINNIQIQADYGLGLANINPLYDGKASENTNTNGLIQLSVAYFL